jgi:hypothetical protein
MRATDARARAILERTESLTPEQLLRLSGYRVQRSGDERRGEAGDELARRTRGRR